MELPRNPNQMAASPKWSRGHFGDAANELTSAAREETLLDPYNHRVWTHQVFDAGLPESCLRHPPDTVGTRLVEPPFRLDQHIQAHQKLFLFQIPVVENVAHHHDIDLWQGIVEETSRGEVEPVRQAVLSDVGLEDGAHLGKVEAQTCQVGMSEGDLDGEVTLGGSRIDEGLVVRPRKLCGDRNVRATTDARHRGKELFELGRIGVEGVEERFTAARGFIIGLPRS